MLSDYLKTLKDIDDDTNEFIDILINIYKNEKINNNIDLNNLNIIHYENDIIIYGKDIPLYKSLSYFNEVPIFNEKQAITFLKKNNIDPSVKLIDMPYNERIHFGRLILNKIISKIPPEYVEYSPKLIFGQSYYLKIDDGYYDLNEYVSKLNMLYKLKKYRTIKKCVLNRHIPSDKDVLEYKKGLIKSLKNFKKFLNDNGVSNGFISINNKNYPIQYVILNNGFIDKIKALFGLGVPIEHIPFLVNVSYSLGNLDFLKMFFIFRTNFKSVDICGKVPKLLYYKEKVSLKEHSLMGKYIYFGNIDFKTFKNMIKK